MFDWVQVDEHIAASCAGIQIPAEGVGQEWLETLVDRPRYRVLTPWRGARDGKQHALAVFDGVDAVGAGRNLTEERYAFIFRESGYDSIDDVENERTQAQQA